MKYRVIERVRQYSGFTSSMFVVQYETWDYGDDGGVGLRWKFPFIYLRQPSTAWYDDKKFATLEEAKAYITTMGQVWAYEYSDNKDTVVYEPK